VASVNGQPITGEAFERELARFEAGRVALGYQEGDTAAYKQQVMDLLIEQELIRQTAIAQGIVVTDDAVDASIAQMVQESGGQDYYNSWLTANYYKPEEFREVIRLQLMANELSAPIAAAVPTVTEQCHARHILVNSQAEADQILQRIQAGEDFATLAGQYSLDQSTRLNGGDLGWFPRDGLLVPEVEQVAFNLAPGQIGDVVQSALGYHIIQVLEFDPARPVLPETRLRLVDKALERWRLGLRNGANIQVFLTFN
jgi:parvulin-like peptidyl-prolyl isomerase